MNNFKLTALGVAVVTALALICATSLYVAAMLVLNRSLTESEVRAATAGPPSASSLAPLATVQRATPEPESLASPTVTSPSVSLTAVTGGQVTHTVQSGENLYRISLAYGVTVSDIMVANGLVDSRLIVAGQTLVIPVDRAVAAPLEPSPSVSGDEIPAATPSPTIAPTSTPMSPIGVNGLTLEAIVVMPDNVLQSARQIYARGQELGRNPSAYSKLGDSTIENPFFMARFDEGPYDLGDYAYLQATIDHFSGSHGRQGVGVRRGFHSWTVTDPAWADKSLCLANESPVACEIRLHNPSIMMIRLGSNDAGVPGGFEKNLRQVLDLCIDSGVIPVLGTKADRFEGSNINNEILRRLAAEYQIPLWDFDLVASTIPGRGLDIDGVHLTTFYAHNYTSPTAFQRGHSMHNLTALMALETLWREVIRESE